MSAAASMSALDEFNAALSRYLVWTNKGQGSAVEQRARSVAFELYRVFRKIAQKPQKLIEEISARGYEIKRRKDPKTGKAITPEQEVDRRIRSLRFLSVSFLFAAWRNSKYGKNDDFEAVSRYQKRIGEALLRTADGTENPHATITSFLEGVVVQNRNRGLIDEALRNQSADMGVYIARKTQEYLQGTFKKTYAVTGTVTVG